MSERLEEMLRIAKIRQRFESYVMPEPNSGCWLWTGVIDKTTGYSRLWVGRDQPQKVVGAHRYSYWIKYGPVPDGLVLDHLCRVRCCVNPDHLEPVTVKENTVRGISPAVTKARWSARTHCRKGHPITEENIKIRGRTGERLCRVCVRISRERPEVKAAARLNQRAYQARPSYRALKNAKMRQKRAARRAAMEDNSNAG